MSILPKKGNKLVKYSRSVVINWLSCVCMEILNHVRLPLLFMGIAGGVGMIAFLFIWLMRSVGNAMPMAESFIQPAWFAVLCTMFFSPAIIFAVFNFIFWLFEKSKTVDE